MGEATTLNPPRADGGYCRGFQVARTTVPGWVGLAVCMFRTRSDVSCCVLTQPEFKRLCLDDSNFELRRRVLLRKISR